MSPSDRRAWTSAEVQLVRLVQICESALRRESIYREVKRSPELLVALDAMIERGLMKVATRRVPRGLGAPADFEPKSVTGIYFVPRVHPRFETGAPA